VDAVTRIPVPRNEDVHHHAASSAERAELLAKLADVSESRIALTCTIGGQQRMGGGERSTVLQPHRHAHVLGECSRWPRFPNAST